MTYVYPLASRTVWFAHGHARASRRPACSLTASSERLRLHKEPIEHEIVVPGEGPPRCPDPPLTPVALDAPTISVTELLDFALRR